MIWQVLIGTDLKVVQPTAVPRIVVRREEGEAFKRVKMSGSLTLQGEDYAWVNSILGEIECCANLVIQCYQNCGTTRELVAESECPIGALEWNYEECTVTASKLRALDIYAQVFKHWEKEINLMNYDVIVPFESTQEFVPPSDYNPKSSRKHRGRYLLGLIRWLWNESLKDVPELVDWRSMPEQISQYLGSAINPYNGQTNRLAMVVIEHIADCKRPGATSPQSVSKKTLKEMLELLKMLNCWWSIEKTDIPERPYRLRLEHWNYHRNKTYQKPGVTLDLTAGSFVGRVSAKRIVVPDYSKLYGVESLTIPSNDRVEPLGTANNGPEDPTFRRQWGTSAGRGKDLLPLGGLTPENNFRYDSSPEFVYARLAYDPDCAPTDDKGEPIKQETTNPLLYTNFLNIVYRPDDYPDDGFVLVEIEDKPNAPTVRQTASGVLFLKKTKVVNGNLAATNIFYDWHREERSFSTGTLSTDRNDPNNEGKTVTATDVPARKINTKSIVPYVTLDKITISGCQCDLIDISGFTKTWYGSEGITEELEWDTETGDMTLTVVHSDRCVQGIIPEAPEQPCVDCPPYGEFLRSEGGIQYCADGKTVMRRTYTQYFSTGECDGQGKCTEYKETQTRGSGTC